MRASGIGCNRVLDWQLDLRDQLLVDRVSDYLASRDFVPFTRLRSDLRISKSAAARAICSLSEQGRIRPFPDRYGRVYYQLKQDAEKWETPVDKYG